MNLRATRSQDFAMNLLAPSPREALKSVSEDLSEARAAPPSCSIIAIGRGQCHCCACCARSNPNKNDRRCDEMSQLLFGFCSRLCRPLDKHSAFTPNLLELTPHTWNSLRNWFGELGQVSSEFGVSVTRAEGNRRAHVDQLAEAEITHYDQVRIP